MPTKALSTGDALLNMIFADPPYNLFNGGITCHAGKMVSVNKGDWDKSRGVAEDFAFHAAWIAACRRVLSDTGTLWISGTYLPGEKLVFVPKTGANLLILLGVILANQRFSPD